MEDWQGETLDSGTASRKTSEEHLRPDVLFGMHNNKVHSAMEALLYSPMGDIQYILEYLSLNRVMMGNGSFCIAVTHIHGGELPPPYGKVIEGNRMFADAVEERLLQKAIFYMTPVRGNIVTILALPYFGGSSQPEEMRSLLISACTEATGLIQEKDLMAITAISPMFSGAEEIPQSFHRTMDMLDYRLYFGEKSGVFVPEGPEQKPTWYLHRVSEMENQCRLQCALLISGKREDFDRRLQETIDDLRDNVPASLQQFKADCFQYVSVLIAQLMDRKVISEADVQHMDIFALIERSESANQFRADFSRILEQLLAGYFRQLEEAAYASAGNMRRYIEMHYMDSNLTVSGVAAAFQMSQAAFSTCYIRKLGISPLEDLNRCRVRHAYEMLKAGELSLDKVMQSSGFASASTMHRLFKKYYNASPAQLRRILSSPNQAALPEEMLGEAGG